MWHDEGAPILAVRIDDVMLLIFFKADCCLTVSKAVIHAVVKNENLCHVVSHRCVWS